MRNIEASFIGLHYGPNSPRSPEDHAAIQAAIDSTKTGDVIRVATGSYGVRIRLKKNVTPRRDSNDSTGELDLKRYGLSILDSGKSLPKLKQLAIWHDSGFAMLEPFPGIPDDRWVHGIPE